MINKRLFICIALISFWSNAFSQKVITKYWGWTKVIKEQYQVDPYGTKNGYYKYYNELGTLLNFYNWKDGKLNGVCTDYTLYQDYNTATCNGRPMKETFYVDGEQKWEKEYKCKDAAYWLYRKVEKNSEGGANYQTWFANGKTDIKYKTLAYQGREYRHGYSVEYHENGKIAEGGEYQYGAKVGRHFATFDDNDTLSSYWYLAGEIKQGYKKDQEGNLSEVIVTNDSFTEQHVRTYTNGIISRAKVRKTMPFQYTCSLSEGEVKPKNRLDILFLGGKCGLAKNPFENNDDSYIAVDSVFENGKLKDIFKYSYMALPKKEYDREVKYKVLADTLIEAINLINAKTELENKYYNAMYQAVTMVNRKFILNGSLKKKKLYEAVQELINEYAFAPQYIVTANIVSGPVKEKVLTLKPIQFGLFQVLDNEGEYYQLFQKSYFSGYKKLMWDSFGPASAVLSFYAANNLSDYKTLKQGDDLQLKSNYSTYSNSSVPDAYKVVEVRKSTLNSTEDLNRIVADLNVILEAAFKWFDTPDTKDLEKQLKATKDPKELRRLLGI